MNSKARANYFKNLSRGMVALSAAALALIVSGCGDKKEKPVSQTAAKVNKEEITVHQINFVLQQQRGLKQEQAESAGKQVLERLIDQELAFQKAGEIKVDRDPRVVQQLEAAKREIISRAYFEKLGEGASKPTLAEVQKYYDEHPALFKQRRIYSLQELAIEAKPEQIDALQGQIKGAKDVAAFVEYLKANGFKFTGNQVVRAAEQLPMNSLDNFAKMTDGQAIFNPTPAGVQVVVLVGSRSQPVDMERARPAIEMFLVNERKRKIIGDDLKALRAAAKIQYVGKFADAASAPAVAAPTAAEVAASAASGLDNSNIEKAFGLKSGVSASDVAPAPSAPAPQTAADVDAATISRGLGLGGGGSARAPVAPAVATPPASGAKGPLDATTINKGMGF